jgi:capsular exopolysaccharide synthesis family protein
MQDPSSALARSDAPERSVSFSELPALENEGIDLRRHWSVVKKRRRLIAVFLLAVVLTVGLFSFLIPPLYTAETVLLIEQSSPQVIEIKAVLAESLGPDEHDYYSTQYEILRSRSLAAQVIREEKLGSAEASVDSKSIDEYLESLEVEPFRKSRLVKIAFSSTDPELSARIVNAHARAYMRRGLERGTRANAEAGHFLKETLAELARRVQRSEAALSEYRREHGIISLDDRENFVVDRLADLNTRLTDAEARRIGAEAQVRLVREKDDYSLPAVLESPLIATLKEQLTRLEGEHAQLAARFKQDYPQLVQVRAHLEATHARLQREVRSTVAGIESAYQAVLSEERDLRAGMEAQKAEALRLKDAAVDYAILSREAETNRRLHDSVLQRMNETSMATDLAASNVFVIDEAEVPDRHSYPRRGRNLLFGIVLGLAGGLGLAFTAEFLDNTLRTPQDVERFVGLPSLGVVPDFRRLGLPARPQLAEMTGQVDAEATAAKLSLADPLRIAADAYRAIRTGLLFSQAGEPPRTILFTSATHEEGKTATVLHTAVSFSQLGGRVLVIDADLRRPSCHDRLGIENGIGVTEVLTGQGEASKAVYWSPAFSLLASGAAPPNPTELLGSDRMRQLLEELRKGYEYILIDAPPLLPVIDTVVLSRLVDGVVLVVDQQRTPRQVVRSARARLAVARAKVLGVVLNRVDPKTTPFQPLFYGYSRA